MVRNCFRIGYAVVLLLLVLGSSTSTVFGQPAPEPAPAPAPEDEAKAPAARFLELPFEDKLARLGRRTIPDLLRAQALESSQVNTFEKYFNEYFFPRMTRIENLGELPKLRDELAQLFAKAGRNQAGLERLNELTFEYMFSIARGARRAVAANGQSVVVVLRGPRLYRLDGREIPRNVVKQLATPRQDFHPAVKYNAMLIIGNLNDKIGNPPIPRLKVLRPLLSVAGTSTAPDPIRVAALIGIARHSKVEDLQQAIKTLIADTMLQIIKEKPAAGSAGDGHHWIRRQAVQIVGSLAIPGPEGVVVDTLADLIASDDAPFSLRSAAADALGRIEIAAPPKVGVQEVGNRLGGLAVEACQFELGDKTGDAKVSRSRLLSTLSSVSTGLSGPSDIDSTNTGTGLLAVADNASRAFLDRLTKDIDRLKGETQDMNTPDDELRIGLQVATRGLAAYLKAPANGVAPPAAPGTTPPGTEPGATPPAAPTKPADFPF